jgi:hypothetical protein
MKLAQIVAFDLPPLEAREHQLDLAALQSEIPTVVVTSDARGRSTAPVTGRLDEVLRANGATVAHLYGRSLLSPGLLRRLAIPVVAAAPTRPSRIPWRRVKQPDAILDPGSVPPGVDPAYFQVAVAQKGGRRVGVLVRGAEGTRAVGSTRQRIERFRDDVRWSLFHSVPDGGEMQFLDVWIDPTPHHDRGGVPEAMAAGVPVIAARTPSSQALLDDGRAGFLFPPGDANELAHAVLAALFRPEITQPKRRRAAELAERFRLERRAEALLRIYRELSS